MSPLSPLTSERVKTPTATAATEAVWHRQQPVPSADAIRVWVHYGDALLRAGLTAALRAVPGLAIMVPDTLADLDAAIRASVTEVVITDYEQGMQVLRDAQGRRTGMRRSESNRLHVLILTRRDSEGEIRHALQRGALGYLTLGGGIDELINAIDDVHRGLRHVGSVAARRLADSIACEVLTERETDVLHLVSKGQSNKAVARELDIGMGTVKTHLKALFQKLGAHNRTEVAAVAQRRGLLAQRGVAQPRRLAVRLVNVAAAQ
jgi:DNA-binding NarL/FixJ family response regulator